ncbi:hypothetical protein HN51_044649 [Arachis hypogaea]
MLPLGYFWRLLIFDNIENGSLKEHLNDPLKTPLNWRMRLQIANEVVVALEVLISLQKTNQVIYIRDVERLSLFYNHQDYTT